jgi:hypothetical protein
VSIPSSLPSPARDNAIGEKLRKWVTKRKFSLVSENQGISVDRLVASLLEKQRSETYVRDLMVHVLFFTVFLVVTLALREPIEFSYQLRRGLAGALPNSTPPSPNATQPYVETFILNEYEPTATHVYKNWFSIARVVSSIFLQGGGRGGDATLTRRSNSGSGLKAPSSTASSAPTTHPPPSASSTLTT